MTIEIKVPQLPESVADATIATWYKKPGEIVKRDENLVDIETDKVVLEVVAPSDGVLEKIIKDKDATVKAEEVIGIVAAQGIAENAAPTTAQTMQQKDSSDADTAKQNSVEQNAVRDKPQQNLDIKSTATINDNDESLSPSERRALKEQDVSQEQQAASSTSNVAQKSDFKTNNNAASNGRLEKRVPMTRLRAKIAERLLASQHNAAILTTFNEINMAPVIALRNTYKEEFMQKYNVRLGYMGFFVTAVVAALKRYPIINASIDGNDIIYHGYFDIGIAVSTDRGLVVPVLRDADALTMAEIEQKIADFGQRAKTGKLTMEELTGGTFTITNGGIYGSLMSTPIINPPQSAILGVHKIQERPVVENKQIVIRPMTYVALSYDHRIIDGAESVQFLVAVKELLEDPARLLLSI